MANRKTKQTLDFTQLKSYVPSEALNNNIN
jgi:hypothetical protein